jgi:hypothetical protein
MRYVRGGGIFRNLGPWLRSFERRMASCQSTQNEQSFKVSKVMLFFYQYKICTLLFEILGIVTAFLPHRFLTLSIISAFVPHIIVPLGYYYTLCILTTTACVFVLLGIITPCILLQKQRLHILSWVLLHPVFCYINSVCIFAPGYYYTLYIVTYTALILLGVVTTLGMIQIFVQA